MGPIDTRQCQLRPIEHVEWEKLVEDFQDANFQQSFGYVDLLATRRACTHEEVGIWDGDVLIGVASIRIRQLPVVRLGVAYVAGGPLINRGSVGDAIRLRRCLEALRDEYVVQRKLLLRVLAPVGDSGWFNTATATMRSMGIMPSDKGRRYRTFLLNLDRPLEEIRQGLAQKWRNCLNASEKVGLLVRWSSEPSAFTEFRERHAIFVKNKGFNVDLDAAFYEDLQGQDRGTTKLEIAIAEYNGCPVAMHMGSYLGDTAVYLLGLTEDAALESKAAYFLHWEVIKMARERGIKWYDLGGIDPEENPGVFKFKAGFRGIDVYAAGPMDIQPGRIRVAALNCIDLLRSFLRK